MTNAQQCYVLDKLHLFAEDSLNCLYSVANTYCRLHFQIVQW